MKKEKSVSSILAFLETLPPQAVAEYFDQHPDVHYALVSEAPSPPRMRFHCGPKSDVSGRPHHLGPQLAYVTGAEVSARR